MNLLIFSDLHINSKWLKECSLILDEILELKEKFNISEILDLGDTFDSTHLDSDCLDLFSNFIKKANCPIKIIAADSHESTTHEASIVNHFSILNDNVKVYKEYTDGNHLFAGHFILKECSKNYYGGTHSIKELKKYKYKFLGHGHVFEIIAPNGCQLGSSRAVHFDEAIDPIKRIAIIENYKTPEEKVKFVTLKAYFPMLDIFIQNNKNVQQGLPMLKVGGKLGQFGRVLVSSVEEMLSLLTEISENTKVRINFDSYSDYKVFQPYYKQFKEKFALFKDKKSYIITGEEVTTIKKNISLKPSLLKWLGDNKIDKDICSVLTSALDG